MQRLFVGNLAPETTVSDLVTRFSVLGEVREAQVIAGRGFGFVTMQTAAQAEEAIAALNGVPLHGRALRISVAKPSSGSERRTARSA